MNILTGTAYSLYRVILAIGVLTALKSSLEQRLKHVLRLLRLYGDQALDAKGKSS